MSAGGIAINNLHIGTLGLILILAGACLAADNEASEGNWRELARQYVIADEKLFQLEENKLKGIPEQLSLRDKLRAELDQVAQPSIKQLASLLGSPDSLDRKTALVAAIVKQITSPDITTTILNRYNEENDFVIRFYSHQVLKNLSDDQVRSVQADILRISRNEKYETHRITGLPTLLRLERSVVLPVLVEYFKKGSPGLRRATYATLRANHDDYLKEIRSILKRDGATRVLKFIDELDKL